MIGAGGADWRVRYSALSSELNRKISGRAPGMTVGDADVFLCGMSTVVDACIDIRDAKALSTFPVGSTARSFQDMLMARVAAGSGGELKFDWPEGPGWLRNNARPRHSLGGSGPQAAWVLARLGARALIALEDRHPLMLEQIPPGVLIAQNGALVERYQVVPSQGESPETFIFEYTAGEAIAGVVPERSSRIIVRFADRGLQNDADFDHLSVDLAASAAAGLLAGLNDVNPDELPMACDRVFNLARAWQREGLETVHFEFAGYSTVAALNQVLLAIEGSVTSVGMSQSELRTILSIDDNPFEAMAALGARLGVRRLCVHADTWAAAVTKGDPAREQRALMAGCAIASARAAAGFPVDSVSLDSKAEFEPLPFDEMVQAGEWSFVACAAPYLRTPATTLGLGDSFTAGCLLVLGSKD